jgi:crossover junction endodeoxyribonuclease RuvC
VFARVLGIDPGLSRCGWGLVVRGRAGALHAEAAGVLRTPSDQALPQRLAQLADELAELIRTLAPDAVAVERVFFQTNVRTAMSVGQASGLALAAAARAGLTVAEFTPNEVKQAVTGYGGAPKEQVQDMVRVVLGLVDVPKPPDVADALALAVCLHAAAPVRARVVAAGGPATSAAAPAVPALGRAVEAALARDARAASGSRRAPASPVPGGGRPIRGVVR